MKPISMTGAVIIALTGVFATSPAQSQSFCQSVEGNWVGRMKGRFTGPVTMTVKNCKVTWILPDRRTNYCRFSEKAGKVSYSCSLGSQGTVNVNGNSITMRNTFTGNDYVVSVTRK
jgi:hypothetical protein